MDEIDGVDDDTVDGADPPLTVELLADLQAGRFDDATAAQVRGRLRANPAAEEIARALNRVRRDVAALGADSTSAPAAPPAVVARIGAGLRLGGRPGGRPVPRSPAAHAARPSARPARVIAALAGLAAAVAAVVLGTAALLGLPAPTAGPPTTAQHITVSAPAAVIPLSDAQILALLGRDPDYGPLDDPQRRASCLAGLGYPASAQVLGARPIEVNHRRGVLLVLPGDTPGVVAALAVGPNCSSADTGLLANTLAGRP